MSTAAAPPADDPEPASTASTEPSPPTVLPAPVSPRSLSLVVLAVIAGVFALHWASAIIIPVLLALTLAYALRPVVDRLQRAGLPRALAAALLLLSLIGGAGWTGWALSDDATQFVESLPAAAQKLRQALRPKRNQPETAIDKVQAAATQLEEAAKESAAKAARPEPGVTRVQIEPPRFNLKDWLWSSLPRVAAAAGQAAAVLFITFFLLAAGDTFRRKLVRLAGPTFARRKITVQALDEITDQIQRYLLVQVAVSVIVGVATGLAYWALGVEHAAVWGVLAFALNFVPYIGSIVITAGSAFAGFVQFGTLDMAFVLAGVSIALHVVSGNLLAPWLTSRASRLNPVTVFVGVLAFGWLWGLWGLVLGVPILLMVKAVCDRVDEFKPLGEMLGT